MQFSHPNIETIKEKMPHQHLTRIVGEPDYSSLHTLYKEVKANAASVRSTLGGGRHGHLGMVISPTAYAHHSATPWIEPNHPGPFANIPVGTNQHQANHLRDLYNQEVYRFQTAYTVLTIIAGQIKHAIEEDYIADEVDTTTGKFNENLHIIINNLFNEYGAVKTDFVEAKLQELKSKSYDPAVPLAATFARIESLMDLAEAAHISYTLEQRFAISISILEKTGKFGNALKEWYALTAPNKT